jgi:cell division protein FtsB
MNSQDLLNIAFGACSGVLGWFARELWAAVKELKSDLAKLREELPRNYVIRDDYKDDIREIKEMLTKLFDRIDNKADK